MTMPPLAEIPVRTADELTRRWIRLLDPPVFAARSLWLTWLGADGRMLPLVMPIDDVPRVPDRRLESGLVQLHDAVTEEHLRGDSHLAMALCRPGRADITDDDDEWAQALHDALDHRIDGTWSLHLAAAGYVGPIVDPPAWAWRRQQS